MSRIYKDKVELDPKNILEFFENRGRNISSENPLTSILYQDDNPELAKRRDAYEKQRAIPLLHLHPQARVLDVGCGIGRWAEALIGEVASYHGIDFSASLIEAARTRIQDSSCSFQVLPAQEVKLDLLPGRQAVSHVLIAGVLHYLNDDDARQTLANVATCCASSAVVYLREAVALDQRLTLKDFESQELKTRYSSIYRSPAELQELCSDTLEAAGFRKTTAERLYPAELNNRRETEQRIFIFERQ